MGNAKGEIGRRELTKSFLSNASMISSGQHFSLILTKSNNLYTCQENNLKQIRSLNIDSTISQISTGSRHSLVLTKDNSLYSIGTEKIREVNRLGHENYSLLST
jgi:alpha-tubulin suppressor-like RCC1 family protein